MTFLKNELGGLDSAEGVEQFEKLIRHFELTEHSDFRNYFKNTKSNPLSAKPVTLKPKLPNVDLYLQSGTPLFPFTRQDRVIAYWRQRQKELRRPLLRKHWRILHLSNHGYGEQDNNKLAFANRTNNKMNLRKSNRMLSGLPLVEKLRELLRENRQALFMVRMVRQREELKLDQLLLGFRRKEATRLVGHVSGHLESASQLLAQAKEEVLAEEPFAEPSREDKEDHEQDCLAYFCNIVTELGALDLQLENFCSRSLDAMKDKFFELKNQAGLPGMASSRYSHRLQPRGGARKLTEERTLTSVSDKLLYYVSMQTKQLELPTLVVRKGYPGEYFIDKLNPKYWDERYYERKNFSSPERFFQETQDPFFQRIRARAREEAIKRDKEGFGSPEESPQQKTFLRKRGNSEIERQILERRLAGVGPAAAVQESLFRNLKFSESSFCDRFLRRVRNR